MTSLDVAALLETQDPYRIPTLTWAAALIAANADNVEDGDGIVIEGGTISHPITVTYQPPDSAWRCRNSNR